MPKVSIIIPTKNSEKTLKYTLASIKCQKYANYEIIVVDTHSTDKTRDIAKNFGARVILSPWERSLSINLGVMKSEGDIVYIVGSDYILVGDLLREISNLLQKNMCDAIVVTNIPAPISIWAKVRLIERLILTRKGRYVATRVFKKKIFLQLRGYNPQLIVGEDFDLQERIIKAGYKVCLLSLDKGKEYHIGEPKSLVDVMKKLAYYAKSINRFAAEHSVKDTLLKYNTLTVLKYVMRRPWSRYLFHFLLYNAIKGLYMILGMIFLRI